jgi:hypothetical protein
LAFLEAVYQVLLLFAPTTTATAVDFNRRLLFLGRSTPVSTTATAVRILAVSMTSEYDIPSPACCLDYVFWLIVPESTRRCKVITETRLLQGFEQGLIRREKKLPDGIGPQHVVSTYEADLAEIAYDHAVDAAFKQWFPQGRKGYPQDSKYFLDLHWRHPDKDKDDHNKVLWTLYRWTPKDIATTTKEMKQKRD